MSELVAARVRESATRLGLTHLSANLPELLARADADKLGYLELLDLVTGEETAAKDNRRYHHALKLAGLFLGPPGVGKTHLACSLAVAACQAGHMTYYTSLDDMVRKLRAADAAGSLSRQIRTYLRPTLLVIDLCRPRDYAGVPAV